MKRILMLLLVIGSVGLTGCVEKNTMSDGEINIVAEHIAVSILNQQDNYKPMYDSTLLKKKEIKTEAPTPTQVPENNTGDKVEQVAQKQEADKQEKDSSIEEILDLKKFTVEYKGYGLYESYPDDETMAYFSLTPSSIDNQFLVISFIAKNNTKKEQTLNLKDVKVGYQLDIDTGSMYKPLLTLMPNDMQYIVQKVKSKESTELILVFEVSKDVNMQKINLLMSRGDQARIIKLK